MDTASPNNFNFSSKDIKKGEPLPITAEQSPYSKFITKLKAAKQKLQNSPPLKGRRKYITLSATILIIAAAITLPLLLPTLVVPPPSFEEQQQNEEEVKQDISNIINNLDPNAPEETQNVIIATIEEQIAAAKDDDSKFFFLGANANALQQFGRYDEAVTNLETSADIMQSADNHAALIDIYGFMGVIHERSGDKASAIESYRLAVAAALAATANGVPFDHSVRYYNDKISALENS